MIRGEIRKVRLKYTKFLLSLPNPIAFGIGSNVSSGSLRIPSFELKDGLTEDYENLRKDWENVGGYIEKASKALIPADHE